jgi:hypothetical protein
MPQPVTAALGCWLLAACVSPAAADEMSADEEPTVDEMVALASQIISDGKTPDGALASDASQIVVSDHRRHAQLDELAQRPVTPYRAPRVFAADLVGKEKTVFAVVADSFRRRQIDYSGVAAADAEVYWSYDYPFDRPEVRTGLGLPVKKGETKSSAAGGGLRKVNHLPGVFFLAVKSAFCARLMEVRAELPWFDISPAAYSWAKKTDRAALAQVYNMDSVAGRPSFWMRKVGSHRNTSLHSTAEPLPTVPLEEADETIFQRYIARPLLADGKKFELRLFVAITCLEPLSVYLYRDFYLRVAGKPYEHDVGATMADNMVHQITGVGKDIQAQEKWPRAKFEVYLGGLGYNYTALMQQIKQVVGLSVLAVEGKMHAESQAFDGGDARRFYEVLGFDILIEEVPDAKDPDALPSLHPYVLEVNFNPDASLYHKEDVGPKGGAWHDVVSLAGLLPGTAEPTGHLTDAELAASLGLGDLPSCNLDSDGSHRQNATGADRKSEDSPGVPAGLQRFDRARSMRHQRSLLPIRPLTCVTRYDLELIAEAEAELMRAGGYDRVLPSAELNGYAMFLGGHRYADLVLQRLLSTPRNPPTPPKETGSRKQKKTREGRAEL